MMRHFLALLGSVVAAAACDSTAAEGGAGDDLVADVEASADLGAEVDAPPSPDGADAGVDAEADVAPAPSCPVTGDPEPGVVATDLGAVRGVVDGATWAFRGLPYAAPPVDALRWRPPTDPPCYEGVLDAATFGAACPQLDSKTDVPLGSEDCLTLNVWTPQAEAAAPRPVMFFIHGGGNIQGSSRRKLAGGAPIYAGRHLAETHGVVVVTVQYRLGPLGFLALPELSARSERGTSGNYGILDQLHALGWVQRNIAAFGGDPARVMVFGESAGAVDTCTLLASPLAAGLLHAALMQSGGCSQPAHAVSEAAMSTRVDDSRCGGEADRLACLLALSPAELLADIPGSIGIGGAGLDLDPAKYGPLVDGWVLERSPYDALVAGEHHRVPFIIGTNAEELAGMATFSIKTQTQLEQTIQATFGLLGQDLVDALLAAYPAADYASPQDALVALLSDMRFTCPARRIARAAAASQSEPVWRYFFTRRAVTKQGELPASHGRELVYVFGTLEDIPLYQPDPGDRATSALMMGYWSRFAAMGDPNGGDDPAWPPYGDGDEPVQRLASPADTVDGVRTAQCAVWDTLFDRL